MKHSLAYYGNPVLRKKCCPVTVFDENLKQLVQEMFEAMHQFNGIGLAANQIQIEQAIFVTAVPIEKEDGEWEDGPDRVFINPKIISYSPELQTHSEGCLSIPKIYLDITRPLTIQIQAMDLSGQVFEETLTGFAATNFMHENDHLNGVLMIDRVDREERKAIEPLLKQIKKKHGK